MQSQFQLLFVQLVQPPLHSDHFLPQLFVQSGHTSPEDKTARRQTGEKRTALVVDDVADVTELLEVLLTQAGYKVVTAGSAKAALAAAHQLKFDVIISDIGMPEMNGYQLAEALRQLPEYQTVPLVAITGYSMFDDQQRSKKAGFNAHMTKPIDPRALIDLIDHL
jgi:two-component system, chemotaxis family, CheB/CheR fusion protein